jgi:Uma2 family endonuclease
VDELNETLRREAEARERFRASLDEDVRAEFINGEVVTDMVAKDRHMTATRNIGRLADVYASTRQLGIVRTEQALTGFTRNDYAPDVCFWSPERSQGVTGDTLVYPVPDFVAEVLSPSTEARDRGIKFEDYAAHGVSEYWIVDPETRVIEQYFADGGKYRLAGKFANGVVKCRAIAGLEISIEAAFDERANLEALRRLLG